MANLQIENDPLSIMISLERTVDGDIWIRANKKLFISLSDDGEITIHKDTYKKIYSCSMAKIILIEGMIKPELILRNLEK